jgi:hypothetical protein
MGVMMKRIWVGGLLLSLGGWASDLVAQDAVWKPASNSVSLTQPTLAPCPTVTLGRPVPIKPANVRRPQPPSGVVPVAYQEPAPDPNNIYLPPIPPPALPDTLPNWPDEDQTEDAQQRQRTREQAAGGFASERAPWGVSLAKTGPVGAAVKPTSLTPQRSGPTVVQTGQQADILTPLSDPRLATYSPPAPLPDGIGGVEHDFWAPDVEADPLRRHFYVGGEYLYWWTKADRVPPLVTTSDPNNVNPNGRFGFLGQTGTETLFGGGGINGGGTSGFRLTAGYWLDMYQEEGVEISGFLLGPHTTHFSASSADFPVLARPFFNLNSGTEFSELVAFPGVANGRVSVDTISQLWGIEGNLRCNVCCGCDRRLDVFGGFRYLDLRESINILEDIQGLAGAPAPFTNQHALVFDSFATHNSFYGGQVGVNYDTRFGRWSLDFKGKVGIGFTDTKITINGGQNFLNANGGVTTKTPGGLLALSSNSGTFHKDHFSFVPEAGLNLGYQVNDNIRIFGGYNFLYWTGVMRPGDQIDRNLDVTRIPNFLPVAATPLGGAHPGVPFRTTDFWAHGINVGIEFRY